MFPAFTQSRLNRLAVAAAALIALLALLSLSTLGSTPVLGARSTALEGGSQALTWVMPGGYAYEAGLRPGNILRFAAPPPGSAAAWGAVEVIEGARAGQVIVLSRRWPESIDLVLFALGLEFLLASLIVYLRASDRPAAHRFTVLAGSVAATLVALPAIGDGHPWALALEWFGSKVGMAAFALFFLTTPVQRWKPLQRLLSWAPFPLLAFYSYTVLAQLDLYATVKPLGYSYFAVGLVTSSAAMVWPFLTRAPREHRRLWPVALGSGLAAALYLIGGVLPYLLLRRYLLPVEVVIAGLGLVPGGFVWTMVRYPFMGMTLGPWAVVKTVFETITDPIFVVRQDGQLVHASRAGLELLGITKVREAKDPFEQMANRLEMVHPDGTSLGGSLLRRVLAGEVVRDEERLLRLPRDETAWMSIAGTPLFNERGEVDMAVLVCRNITERKRREEERLELDRQKDEFLANISHDLRTPLTAIKSSVGVVIANEPSGFPVPLHRMLVNADISVDKMASLVEDLLELARLQAGRVQPRLDRCNLRDLALRSAASIEPLASSRHQKLVLDLPPDPLAALADGERLERALANLLSNAHHYGRTGGTIRLSLRRRANEALFAVADDGPGIPEAEQERIFERFYRPKNGNARANGGCGLGLPIARAMVELHGGRTWVESKPGAGSTFWIAIPLRDPAHEDRVTRSASIRLPEASTHAIGRESVASHPLAPRD